MVMGTSGTINTAFGAKDPFKVLYSGNGSTASSINLASGSAYFDTYWYWTLTDSSGQGAATNGSVSINGNCMYMSVGNGGAIDTNGGYLTFIKSLFTTSNTVWIKMQIALTGNRTDGYPSSTYFKLRDALSGGNSVTIKSATSAHDFDRFICGSVSDSPSTVADYAAYFSYSRMLWIKLVKTGTSIEVYRLHNTTNTSQQFTSGAPFYDEETLTDDGAVSVASFTGPIYISFDSDGTISAQGYANHNVWVSNILEGDWRDY